MIHNPRIIHTIWEHVYNNWTARNADKHGFDEETRRAAKLEETKRIIENLYDLKDRCLRADQTSIFHANAQDHVEREPRLNQQQAWIETYEPIILNSVYQRDLNRSRGDRMIDDYFPPL